MVSVERIRLLVVFLLKRDVAMKYEYKVSSVEINDAPKSMGDQERFLNKLGESDWELISIFSTGTKKNRGVAYFKRPEKKNLILR